MLNVNTTATIDNSVSFRIAILPKLVILATDVTYFNAVNSVIEYHPIFISWLVIALHDYGAYILNERYTVSVNTAFF